MEEQECEVLWLSKKLQKRKIAELRLLQRIEKGFNHQPTEIDTNEREKLLESYSKYLAEKKRNVPGFLKNNFEVGITEYISNKHSFSAKVCRVNSESQVKETQFMTAENKSGSSIMSQRVEENHGKESVGHLKSQLLQSDELKSNHFKVALTKVKGDLHHIETCLQSLEDVGFINYYESLEFGYLGDKHLIGKELVLERWQEAIDLILEKWFVSKRPSEFALACFLYKSSRDVNKALDIIAKAKTNHMVATLLYAIKRHGGNLSEALITVVPVDLQLSYVHAYQCFIWNKIVSKRLAKFGSKLIVGDLVYAQYNNEKEVNNQREVIFIDDGNIHEYTIYDAVIPLPRHDTIYPANEVAGWYFDFFRADGISEKDFILKSKDYDLGGAYRPIMVRPTDLKWKFVHFDNPDQNFISSYLDRLQPIGIPPVGLQGGSGAYLGLVLDFNLPAFAFPSMALREILKMDMNEVTLNELKKKELSLNQERPSSNKSKENPYGIIEINNSFLDCRPASTISESSQASSLRNINLASDTVEKQPSIDSLGKQRSCPSSISKFQPNGNRLEPSIIESLPLTKKPFEEPQFKKEPGDIESPSPISRDLSEEPQRNQIRLELKTSNQMPQLTVSELLQENRTVCAKEEPGISPIRKSTFIDSCEEPAKKKIKADPDAIQKEMASKVSNFKSIIYIDLSSDEED